MSYDVHMLTLIGDLCKRTIQNQKMVRHNLPVKFKVKGVLLTIASNPSQFQKYLLKKRIKACYIHTYNEQQDLSTLGYVGGTYNAHLVLQKEYGYDIYVWKSTVKNKIFIHELKWVNGKNGLYVKEPDDYQARYSKLLLAYDDIMRYAKKINEDYFADKFSEASVKLKNTPKHPTVHELLGSIYDPFGAMGSWNDSPKYQSHITKTEEEYSKVSHELYKQISLVCSAFVNK